MVKIMILTILAVLALGQVQTNQLDNFYEIYDSMISPLMPIGIPDQPLVEDGEKLRKLCSLINKDFIMKQSDKVGSFLKGLSAKIAKHALDNFSSDKYIICKLALNGQTEKASLMAKEYNKPVLKVNKVRLSLLKVLDDLAQTGTKASLPKLACYLKEAGEKVLAIYSDGNGAKELIETAFTELLSNMYVKIIENEAGKAADTCPLPEVTTNTSKYNSVFLALFRTILTIQDK